MAPPNSWAALPPSPLEGRRYHTAVWATNETGLAKLIVWGGAKRVPGAADALLGDGALYDPKSNAWTPMAPSTPRERCASAWTGSRLIVWGGDGTWESGASYDPISNTWQDLPASPVYNPNSQYAAWTGKYALIFGIGKGSRYEPTGKTWSVLSSVGAPRGENVTPIWTGSEWIFWGGIGPDGKYTNTGAAYDPEQDRWTALPTDGAPSARGNYAATWTGKLMIVWGGFDDAGDLGVDLTGSVYTYDPSTQAWRQFDVGPPPTARIDSTVAVAANGSMLVWGGVSQTTQTEPTGAKFTVLEQSDAASHSFLLGWAPLSASGAPRGRIYATANWTGQEMIVWGGQDATLPDNAPYLADGGRYTP